MRLLVALLFVALPAVAEVTLAPIFGSNMVLQHDAQVRSIELNLESKSLIITASLGYFDGEGDWVPAKFATSETMFRVDIAKADLGTLLGDAIPFVDAVIQRLADDGMCEGTVV